MIYWTTAWVLMTVSVSNSVVSYSPEVRNEKECIEMKKLSDTYAKGKCFEITIQRRVL